jgi:methylamine--corrinoid protein Co-methyltransferase
MHNTTCDLLWGVSLVYQALARNAPLVSLSNGFAAAGPCTRMVLYEAAAHALASVVSGSNLWEIAVAKNKYKNRATPMEAKMACEVGCGAAESGIKRSEANQLVKKIASKYAKQVPEAPLGKMFQECYDVKRVAPSREYTELYADVKRELSDLGVPFPY